MSKKDNDEEIYLLSEDEIVVTVPFRLTMKELSKMNLKENRKRKRGVIWRSEFTLPEPLTIDDFIAMSPAQLTETSDYENFLHDVVVKLKLILNRFHRRTKGKFLDNKYWWEDIILGPNIWTNREMELGIRRTMQLFEPALTLFPFGSREMSNANYCDNLGRVVFKQLTKAIKRRSEELLNYRKMRLELLRERTGVKVP